MYNRYRGSGSRPERMDPPGSPPRPRPNSPLPPQRNEPPPRSRPGERPPGRGQASPAGGPKPPPAGETGGKSKTPGEARRGLEHILARLDPGKLETEDLLVLAILWLLYRDSGDKDLLIAMGAYLFL